LCLHRIYGFPIIPGSAVKGVTRAWAFWKIAEQVTLPQSALRQLERLLSEGDEQEQKQLWTELQPSRDFSDWQSLSREFYCVFGTTERRGQVVFFDAYPSDPRRLKVELDILNPHYGPYYSDGQARTPPADYNDPRPTYFLTVGKNTPFRFAVTSKDSTLANTARGWLKDALRNIGIGGKTAAGYGFMV
jgi:CRISPR-associated protein Cmr6